MEIGVITISGKFIPCEPWGHIPTALRYGTGHQFLACRNNVVDIVGNLNPMQYKALIDYCIRNRTKVEDITSSDLEDAIYRKRRRLDYIGTDKGD